MRYIKLFEQFEDKEESWWEEESPFDKKKRKETYVGICKSDGLEVYLKRGLYFKVDEFGKLIQKSFTYIKPELKLFEQFEDKEESWWEEESPFDKMPEEDIFVGVSRIDGTRIYRTIINGENILYRIDTYGRKYYITPGKFAFLTK